MADYSLLRKIQVQWRKPQSLKNGLKIVGLRPTYTVVLAPRKRRKLSVALHLKRKAQH